MVSDDWRAPWVIVAAILAALAAGYLLSQSFHDTGFNAEIESQRAEIDRLYSRVDSLSKALDSVANERMLRLEHRVQQLETR